MAEHAEIVDACGDLRRACVGPSADVTGAADRLRGLLQPHTRAEEIGIFAVLAEDEEFTDHVGSLCEEHGQLEKLLAEVAAGHAEVMPVFERALREHIDREENGLFPAAAIAFAGPEWERVDALTPAVAVRSPGP